MLTHDLHASVKTELYVEVERPVILQSHSQIKIKHTEVKPI